MSQQFDANFNQWMSLKREAIELSNICSKLEIDKKTDLVLLRRKLSDKTVSEIINLHERATVMLGEPISVSDTLQIAKAIESINIAPSRIDLFRLCNEWNQEKANHGSVLEFTKSKLEEHIGEDKRQIQPKDVILYGFGRIGRLVARILAEEPGSQLRLKAIVIRMKNSEEIEKRAYLLKKDSIHGEMKGTVAYDVEESTLIVNGQRIKIITSSDPATIDYTAYGIHDALLIDSTGAFRDEEKLSLHLKSNGVSKVLLTAPAKGDLPNIVYGVNHKEFDPTKIQIFSAASCTTNAVVPILKVVYENFGISTGHMA